MVYLEPARAHHAQRERVRVRVCVWVRVRMRVRVAVAPVLARARQLPQLLRLVEVREELIHVLR